MNGEQLAASGELSASLRRPLVSMLQLAPGLHRGIAAEDYHFRELGIASSSALEEVRRSPAHYLAWVAGNEYRESPALSFGKALHMRALEPLLFARTYLVAPDFGPCRKTEGCSSEQAKENKARREAWRAEHRGATILDSATGFATLGMIEAIADHPIARPLLESGEAELTGRWNDLLPCKLRADFYREDLGTLVDVKSTLDASADAFRRSVISYGYHRQTAHYEFGLEALGYPADHALFVVAEKAPPFAVAVYALDDMFTQLGERQVDAAKHRLADCLERNEWPGYPDTIQTLSLPPWMKD